MTLNYLLTKEILESVTHNYIFIGLVTLIVFDFITGVFKGVYLKTLSSEYGIKGVVRMLTVLILIIIIGFFTTLTKQDYIFITFATFFILEYAISIIENLNMMNIPLPSFLTDFIMNFRTMNEKKLEEQMKGDMKKDDRLQK